MSGILMELDPFSLTKPSHTKLYHPPNTSLFEYAWAKPTRAISQNIEIYSGEGFQKVHRINLLNIDAHLLGAITCEFTTPAIRHPGESKIDYREQYVDGDDSSDNLDDNNNNNNNNNKKSSSKKSNSRNRDAFKNGSGAMPEHFSYFVQSFGHTALEQAAIEITEGDVLMHNSDYLEIADEVTNPRSHCTDEIIGRCKTEKKLWRKSKSEQVYYVPLRFWFCEMVQASIPLCNIDKSKNKLNLRLKTRDLYSCYYSTDGAVPKLSDSSRELGNNDLRLKVFADVYFVTKAEKDERSKRDVKFLINQVQYNQPEQVHVTNNIINAPRQFKLAFSGPISEIMFVVQKDQHVIDKDYFNWSGENDEDPVKTVSLQIGTNIYMPERNALWFRSVILRRRHTNAPNRHIYFIPIGEWPEKTTVASGTYDFNSAGDQVCLNLRLQRGLKPALFKAWGIRPNVFEIQNNNIKLTSADPKFC